MRRTLSLLSASLLTALIGLPVVAANAGGAFEVTATASTSSVVIGDPVKFTGSVTPAKAGSRVDLQVRHGKKAWELVRHAKIKSDGTFRVADRPASVKPTTYRVVMPGTKKRSTGYSAEMRVAVYRWHYLSDLDRVDSSGSIEAGDAVSINGTVYKKSLNAWAGWQDAWVEYNLSRKCSTLKGTMGLSDESATGALGEIEILGDGNSIFDRTFPLGESETRSLTVSNVLRLRIEFTPLSDDDDADGAVGKPQVLCRF